jgi:energy-converting hydrogenase Eha subunit A
VVAISINLQRILSHRGLPERGLVTLLLLLGVLVVSLMALEPGQSRIDLGWELFGEGVVITVAVITTTLLARPEPGQESHLASALTIAAIGSVPFIAAGISVLSHAGGGLEWVLGGFISAIVGSMLNAWILLVEVL